MPKRILALVFITVILVTTLFVASFAAIKGLESALDLNIIKTNENIDIPQDSEVKSAVAIGGSINVAGKVKEDVVAIGGNVIITKSAIIEGNVVSIGGKIEKETGAIIKGDLTELAVPAIMMAKGFGFGLAIFGVISFISFLIIAAAIILLFGKQIGVVSYYIEQFPGKALLWGFAGAVIILPAICIMVLSIIGITLIPVLLITAAAGCLLGYIAAAQLLGKITLKYVRIYNKPMMFEAIAGMIILFIIGMIPIIGWIVKALAAVMGLGSVMVTRFGTQNK